MKKFLAVVAALFALTPAAAQAKGEEFAPVATASVDATTVATSRTDVVIGTGSVTAGSIVTFQLLRQPSQSTVTWSDGVRSFQGPLLALEFDTPGTQTWTATITSQSHRSLTAQMLTLTFQVT